MNKYTVIKKFRIENAPTLTNEKVDKGAYELVRGKLTTLTEKKPSPDHSKEMPGTIFINGTLNIIYCIRKTIDINST